MSLTHDGVASGTIQRSALLQDIDATLILHLYRIATPLAASILQKGASLIEEYLEIIRSYTKNLEEMRQRLVTRGVNIPAHVPNSG